MHELSIAAALLVQVEELARANGLVRVGVVRVQVGARRQVVPESLAMAFEAVSLGTLAEGAVLEQTEVPMQARCRACAADYAPSLRDFRCPVCGQAAAEITAGNDITIASLTGDTPD